MLFKDHKKNLSNIFLTVSTILSCMCMLWVFYAQSWDIDNISGGMVWGVLAMAVAGFVSLLYLIVNYYRTLFLLFGVKLSDGRVPLAKLKILIWLDIALCIFEGVWFGKELPALYLLCNIIGFSIGIFMYIYLRGLGFYFYKCMIFYAFLCVFGFFLRDGAESALILSFVYVVLMMAALICNAVFIYYAKRFYRSLPDESIRC